MTAKSSSGSEEQADELTYEQTGVLENQDAGLPHLLSWLEKTAAFRKGLGSSAIATGYFASVLNLGGNKGLAIATDGVGTKILIAEMMGKFDTLGIDLVAMNANDVICVGAEPLALVDYIAVNEATPALLEDIGKGLHAGAELANISIPGGELAQVGEMITGQGRYHIDLVGTCVGLADLDKLILGQDLVAGDVIVALESSGLHSNGFTLAREALLNQAKYKLDDHLDDLGRTLGEELLEPTEIYVKQILAALESGVELKALVNITGGGFLNLNRIASKVGFEIESLPQPQPIFELIQKAGRVGDEEMFRVFNMGVGFCIVVGKGDVDRLTGLMGKDGARFSILGEVVADSSRGVVIHPKKLQSREGRFVRY